MHDMSVITENQRIWPKRRLRIGLFNYQRHQVAGNGSYIPGRVRQAGGTNENKNLTDKIKASIRVEINCLFSYSREAQTCHTNLKITHLDANMIPAPDTDRTICRAN